MFTLRKCGNTIPENTILYHMKAHKILTVTKTMYKSILFEIKFNIYESKKVSYKERRLAPIFYNSIDY